MGLSHAATKNVHSRLHRIIWYLCFFQSIFINVFPPGEVIDHDIALTSAYLYLNKYKALTNTCKLYESEFNSQYCGGAAIGIYIQILSISLTNVR